MLDNPWLLIRKAFSWKEQMAASVYIAAHAPDRSICRSDLMQLTGLDIEGKVIVRSAVQSIFLRRGLTVNSLPRLRYRGVRSRKH